MAKYEIPLIPENQMLKISLAGVVYTLTVVWNNYSNNWNIDIADANGITIVSSIPLVAGEDLLGQFGYLNFGGQLIAEVDNDSNANPNYTNLGSTGHLYFITT